MKKLLLFVLTAGVVFVGTYRITYSHCEIPCGIYGDKTRIDLLYEDVATIEKSMKQILALMDADEVNANQAVRWINNKEEHANKVQHVVTQYWMTQRIKPKTENDGAAYAKYVKQLTLLHNMLVHAMKCKQTTDPAHTQKLRALIDEFAGTYFGAEDLEHIRSHHGKHAK